MSTGTTLSSTSSEDSQPQFKVPDYINIFQQAATYGEVLSEEPENGADSSEDVSERSSLSDAQDSEATLHDEDAVEAANERLGNLVLDNKVEAGSLRIAQLSVNTFHTPGDRIHGLGGELTSDTSSDSTSKSDVEVQNDRVVPLLIREFGGITEDGEEELFITEADGAFFQDVAILGLIHLTSHRITFHASLLSTRPDLLPNAQLIKSGPVIVHREGFHRKKRVWLELSHDMICSFPDSTDAGRVRPLQSHLLTACKDIKPIDPAEPKFLRITVKTAMGMRNSVVEFDTVESAASWRKELVTAIHNQRQRRSALYQEGTAERTGVRIAIPLHRIESFTCRKWGSFASVITFKIIADSSAITLNTPHTVTHEEVTDTLNMPMEKLKSGEAGTTVTMTVIQGFDPDRLQADITAAKERRVRTPATLDNADQVVVDFGELAFVDPDEIVGIENGVPVVKGKNVAEHVKRLFALPGDEELWHTRAGLGKSVVTAGYLVVTPRFICFWTKGLVSDRKLRFPVNEVSSVKALPPDRFCPRKLQKMVLQIKGQKDLTFVFTKEEERTEAVKRINQAVTDRKDSLSTSGRSQLVQSPGAISGTSTPTSPGFPGRSATEELASIDRITQRSLNRIIPPEILPLLPRPVNLPGDPKGHIAKQHFVCLTIGSRGDVQPYIALCKGLAEEGHEVTIVTHEEYKAWIEGFGIRHRTAGGDPGALMKLSVEHKMFSPQFFKESLGHFRAWLDALLVDSYAQVKESGATVLIESPSAMAGVHIAEALNIPYFRAFTMPWSRTAEYPHAFISPPDFVAGSFNYSTYVLFDNVFWRATAPQINPWRKKILGLKATDLEHLAQQKIPFLYNFSPYVVPKPLDWSDTTMITGYWFLDNPDHGWAAPESLLQFIAKARADKKPLVYIGFGSIVVEHPKAMTRSIVKAVLKSDVRAILNKGWSGRMAGKEDDEKEVVIPPEVYEVDKIPHDWLFPQIDAALHHGGAGTTGASLRAGIPTLIKPWFGDQFFWAARVQKLGAGLRVASLSSSDLAHALTKATSDRVILEKAQAVGERIREEDGVGTAIKSIYTYLHRAGQRPLPAPKHHHSLSLSSSRKATAEEAKAATKVIAIGEECDTIWSNLPPAPPVGSTNSA